MLALLTKVTKAHTTLTAADVAPVLAAGASRTAIEQALAVGWCFNVITRLADAFEFHCGDQAAFDASATRLLSHGYK